MAARPSFAPIRNARPAHHVARDVARASARPAPARSLSDRFFAFVLAIPMGVLPGLLLAVTALAILAAYGMSGEVDAMVAGLRGSLGLAGLEPAAGYAFDLRGEVLDSGLSLDDCLGWIIRAAGGACIAE